MKTDAHQLLDRLLRGAARRGRRRDEAMPYGFDTRVLAVSQAESSSVDLSWLIPVVRGVLALSVAVMLVMVGVSWHRLHSTPTAELAMPLDAVTMGYVR